MPGTSKNRQSQYNVAEVGLAKETGRKKVREGAWSQNTMGHLSPVA